MRPMRPMVMVVSGRRVDRNKVFKPISRWFIVTNQVYTRIFAIS